MDTLYFTCRQTAPFTCGPAVLLSAMRLYGINPSLTEADLAAELGSAPAVGTCHEKLLAMACRCLPVASAGEDCYEGGVAIANIRNPFSGNGHYVLMLGEADDMLRFYCPFVDRIVTMARDDLDWRNGRGDLHGWAINLPNLELPRAI